MNSGVPERLEVPTRVVAPVVLLLFYIFIEIKIKYSRMLQGIRRYQSCRQKSLSRKTDKTMANQMTRKKNIEQIGASKG